MLVKKFQGKTEEEVREKYLHELGPEAVVLSIRTVKPKGIKKFFFSPFVEAIVAIENSEEANLKNILEQSEKMRHDVETLQKIKALLTENNSSLK